MPSGWAKSAAPTRRLPKTHARSASMMRRPFTSAWKIHRYLFSTNQPPRA
jgi:hypothetical protein